MEDLPQNWYLNPPIDFEHKQYILYSHLHVVDSSFLNKKVSPYLLKLENLIKDMDYFEKQKRLIKSKIEKSRYIYLPDEILEDETENLLIIDEILQFSRPQITSRIKTGYMILEKYNQLLY